MAVLEIFTIIWLIDKYFSSKEELKKSEKEVNDRAQELNEFVKRQTEIFEATANKINYELDFKVMNTQYHNLTVAINNSYNNLKSFQNQERTLRIHKDNLKKEMDRLYLSKAKEDHEKLKEFKQVRDRIINTLKDHEINIKMSFDFLSSKKKEKETIALYIRDNCGKGGLLWYEKNIKNKGH